MIFVDSSVWIDYFRDVPSRQVLALESVRDRSSLIVGDLVLAEVLQGSLSEAAFARMHRVLTSLRVISVGGAAVAAEAARNYRLLRSRGVTVRSTIDTLIATRCIVDGYQLLHADRDYLPFEHHLGLRAVPVSAAS